MTSSTHFRIVSILLTATLAGVLAACTARPATPLIQSVPADTSGDAAQPTTPPMPISTETAIIGYYVSGWTWGGCIALTTASVRQLPGIIDVVGDLGSGTLIVTYDPGQVTPEQIATQIETLYTVKGTFIP